MSIIFSVLRIIRVLYAIRVLIRQYAYWVREKWRITQHCCKQLAPIWDELGDVYASTSNVVCSSLSHPALVLIMGTGHCQDGRHSLNEVEGIGVRGFPTILLRAPRAAGQKTGESGESYDVCVVSRVPSPLSRCAGRPRL